MVFITAAVIIATSILFLISVRVHHISCVNSRGGSISVDFDEVRACEVVGDVLEVSEAECDETDSEDT